MHPAAVLTIVGCLAWIAGNAIRDVFGTGVLGWVVAVVTCVLIGFLWEALRK